MSEILLSQHSEKFRFAREILDKEAKNIWGIAMLILYVILAAFVEIRASFTPCDDRASSQN